MMIPVYEVYVGKTKNFMNIYLGKTSAQIAEFLYQKLGIPFETEKTDTLLSIHDFAYLNAIHATTCKRSKYYEVECDY